MLNSSLYQCKCLRLGLWTHAVFTIQGVSPLKCSWIHSRVILVIFSFFGLMCVNNSNQELNIQPTCKLRYQIADVFLFWWWGSVEGRGAQIDTVRWQRLPPRAHDHEPAVATQQLTLTFSRSSRAALSSQVGACSHWALKLWRVQTDKAVSVRSQILKTSTKYVKYWLHVDVFVILGCMWKFNRFLFTTRVSPTILMWGGQCGSRVFSHAPRWRVHRQHHHHARLVFAFI